MIDTEALHVAQLLYGIAERMRLERSRTADLNIRRAFEFSINLIEIYATETALGIHALDDADAYAEAGELTLRRLRLRVHR
jgi:hypothetical protein